MQQSTELRAPFWLLWVVASASGGAVVALVARSAAYAIGYAVGGAAGTVVGEAALGAVAMGGFMTAIAAAQWLVIVRLVPWAGRWLLASGVSGAVAGAVMLSVFAGLTGAVGESAAGAGGVLLGLCALGVTQWVVLRPKVEGAGWLGLATVVGWLGAVIGAVAFGALSSAEMAAGAGFGAGHGAVTGAALVLLDRARVASTAAESERGR